MAKAGQDVEAARGMPGAQEWNPFTIHPHRQGISYVAHWRFAMGIAFRLLSSVVAFALHAILPFLPIAPRLDLEATAAYLKERNRWIESANGARLHSPVSSPPPSASPSMARGMRPVGAASQS